MDKKPKRISTKPFIKGYSRQIIVREPSRYSLSKNQARNLRDKHSREQDRKIEIANSGVLARVPTDSGPWIPDLKVLSLSTLDGDMLRLVYRRADKE